MSEWIQKAYTTHLYSNYRPPLALKAQDAVPTLLKREAGIFGGTMLYTLRIIFVAGLIFIAAAFAPMFSSSEETTTSSSANPHNDLFLKIAQYNDQQANYIPASH